MISYIKFDYFYMYIIATNAMLQDYIDNCVDELLSAKNAKWNWRLLSQNPSISLKIIEKNIEKPWEWSFLSKHPNITWEFIKNNINLDWVWYYICQNPNITFKHRMN